MVFLIRQRKDRHLWWRKSMCKGSEAGEVQGDFGHGGPLEQLKHEALAEEGEAQARL